MVKDFNADFDLITDNQFMTNADVPHLVTDGIVQNLINPFTGDKMLMEKENGAFIAFYISDLEYWKMIRETGNIIPRDEWLHVHTNIFDPANWSVTNIKD